MTKFHALNQVRIKPQLKNSMNKYITLFELNWSRHFFTNLKHKSSYHLFTWTWWNFPQNRTILPFITDITAI